MGGTAKIVLRTQEEFLTDFKPTYNALMPMFLGEGKARSYTIEDGKVDFKRVEAMGDLRGRLFGSKDNEMRIINAREATKGFKKYFLAAKYIQSRLQDRRGYEEVVAQVLDEHNKFNDELFLTGGGTQNSNVVNNGLFFSLDPNYQMKASAQVAKGSDASHLHDLFTKVSTEVQAAEEFAGQKLVLFYGDTTVGKTNALFVGTDNPFMTTLRETFDGVSFAKIPKGLVSGEGYLVLNMDQIKTHYTTLPIIRSQGVNEEEEYTWTNFLMGSSMVEVLLKNGATKQPLTYEA